MILCRVLWQNRGRVLQYKVMKILLPESSSLNLSTAGTVSRGLLEFMIGGAIPDKKSDIVLYCRTGARSAMATLVLNQMGYVNAKNMAGAFKEWGTAGYPVYNRHGEFVMKAFELKK